jgi:hypothetical protein
LRDGSVQENAYILGLERHEFRAEAHDIETIPPGTGELPKKESQRFPIRRRLRRQYSH